MGDRNQRLYLEQLLPSVEGPIVEIGSRDYGSTENFRELYPGNAFVGVDLEAGPGVDMVADLTEGVGSLPESHFGLAICCSVLEHTPRPWIMAQNITRIVREHGWLYIAVPWVWRYHAYPDDYFRFSFRGVAALFPAFDWSDECYATSSQGEIIEIDLKDPGIDNRMAQMLDSGGVTRKYLPYLQVLMLGLKTGE